MQPIFDVSFPLYCLISCLIWPECYTGMDLYLCAVAVPVCATCHAILSEHSMKCFLQRSSSVEAVGSHLCTTVSYVQAQTFMYQHSSGLEIRHFRPSTGLCFNQLPLLEVHFRSCFVSIFVQTFYNRKPKGLAGALSELRMTFDGREHCGLDDARNTALLCHRMSQDGHCWKITKTLESVSR